MGIQGFKVSDENGLSVWAKPLKNNSWTISFFNKSDRNITVNFDWKNQKVVDEVNNLVASFNTAEYKIRDVFAHKDLKTTAKPFKANLASHDVITLVLNKI